MPFGAIRATFNPGRPNARARFVVMEAKFGYHGGRKQKALTDNEFKGRLDKNTQQMSKKWIDDRLEASLSRAKFAQMYNNYARWLYGAQPVQPQSSKRTRSRSGKLMGLAYFPPYALRGFDIDRMNWNV
jgi:hypothetical protein